MTFSVILRLSLYAETGRFSMLKVVGLGKLVWSSGNRSLN